MNRLLLLSTLALLALLLAGCATGRPVVSGLLEEDGMVYRGSESEPWGSRSTLNVRPIEF